MPENETSWTLLSNHAHVLVCLATDSGVRLRDVAERVGITERAVQRIIMELEAANMISRERDGRRNQYRIFVDQPLRHPLEKHHTVGMLLKAVAGKSVR
jgi:DNA-binding MarR family transcriptional regulator